MINKKMIYILLGVIVLFSLVLNLYPALFIIASAVVLLYLNRGLYFIVRANRLIINKDTEKGYTLLERGYNAGIPFVVASGYAYLTLKYGHTEKAGEVIEEILSGQKYKKFKDGQREAILTIKSLFLWKSGKLDNGIEILDGLYENNYRSTTFYGNYGCLLYIKGDLLKAEKISLEAYDYGKTDTVTLDNLVAVYISLENWQEAERYQSELMDQSPGFSEAYFHGAQLEYNNGNYDRANELIELAYEKELNTLSSIELKDIDNLKKKIEEKE